MKVSRTVVLGVGLAVLIVLAGGYQLGVLSPGFGKQAANCAQITSLYGLCEPGPGASVTPVPLIAKLANDSGTVNIPGDSPNLSVAPFASLGTVLWIATEGEAVVAAYELPNFQGGCALIGESGIATTFLFTLPELKGKLGSVRLGKRGGNFGCSALILYEAWNYQGRFISFAGEYERLADLGFDKIASSARVAGPLINNRPYTLYSEPSFSGRCSTIRGDVPQLNALGVGNDQASSVSPSRACRIGVPVSLELHDAPQMGGDKVLFENDVPDLSVIGFNDKTVSLTAQGAARIALYSNPGYQGICLSARGLSIPNLASTVLGNNSLSSFKYGDCPEPQANGPVTLWTAWNYGGDAFSVVQDIPDLRIVNFDNVASSVKVASGSRVALYSEPNYTGVCSSVAVDVPQLNPLPVGNDAVSSVKLNQGCPGSTGGISTTISSDPSAISLAPGGIDLFGRDSGNNSLWHRSLTGSVNWAAPESLDGALAGRASVSSWGGGRMDVFMRGPDGALYQRVKQGSWQPWIKLTGDNQITSDPAAVSWGPNRVDVFAKGNPDGLWHFWWDGTAWKGPENLGGALTSGPTAASWGANRLDVFMKGQNNALWHLWFDAAAGGWGPWEKLGPAANAITSDPAAVSWGPNRVDVFAKGTPDGLWHMWFDGTGWKGPENLGGTLTGGPSASSQGPNLLDIFARDSSIANRLSRKSWGAAGWTGWTEAP